MGLALISLPSQKWSLIITTSAMPLLGSGWPPRWPVLRGHLCLVVSGANERHMKYISTRGLAPKLNFEGAMLSGLARDGGLYVPEHFPKFTKAEMRALRGRP